MSSNEEKPEESQAEGEEEPKPEEVDDSDTDDEGAIIDDAVRPESYRWVIDDFKALQEKTAEAEQKKEHSPIFEIGDVKWRMMIFPNGNRDGNMPTDQHLSFYLEVADHEERSKENSNWRVECKFWLTVVNQDDHEKNVREVQEPQLHAKLTDWGFPKLIELAKLTDPEQGFMKDGAVALEAELFVKRVFNHQEYSYSSYSRDTTGFVGLRNQGATCYLNSLMQGLYHIGSFRRAVHLIPTATDDVSKSIPLALQRLFYKLQTSKDACSTKELTRSFGWSDWDSFKQHDVQELNRVLMDNLETKMKGTPAEGSIERLFRGRLINYFDCVNVEYTKERPEWFYDISLVVKGCKDVYESFDQYVATEMLDGDNKYQTDDFGYQDAKKGSRFDTMPPVLNLQLKRWEMDYVRFQPYKVNDLYRFSPVLDLTRYLPKGTKESGIYHLHAVLVHSGGTGGGHYYAYVRPDTSPKWYKFNDSYVSVATEKEAINDNWGGEEVRHWRNFGKTWSYTHQRTANAYMLIYVRETEAHSYMNDTATDVIQEHLRKISEEHLYQDLFVCTEEDLRQHDQSKFDLIDRSIIKPQRVKKTGTIEQFKEQAATTFNIPVERQRYWIWVERHNKTMRPDRTLNFDSQRQVIQYLKDYYKEGRLLMLEDTDPVEHEGGRKEPPVITYHDPEQNLIEDAVFLLFKYFDPAEGGSEKYVGNMMFSRSKNTTDDLVPAIRKLYGLPDDAEVSLFEEITPKRVEALAAGQTLANAELQCGDIIVFMVGSAADDVKLKNPREWHRFMYYRLQVRFRPLDSPSSVDSEFKLDLNKQMKYEDVAEAVGAHLKVPPTHLRFKSHYPPTNAPSVTAVRKGSSLVKMLEAYYHTRSDLIYYEILPVSLDQIDNMRKLKVALQNKRAQLVGDFDLLIEHKCRLADAFAILLAQPKVKALREENPDDFFGTGVFNMLEVFGNKIYKSFDESHLVDHYTSEHTRFQVEELSPEAVKLLGRSEKANVDNEKEEDAGSADKENQDEAANSEAADSKDSDDSEDAVDNGPHVVTCVHFEMQHTPNLFGNPFTIVATGDEPLSSIKKTIRERLAADEEEFADWKFAILSYSSFRSYLEDDDAPLALPLGEWTHLGIQHKDSTPKEVKSRSSSNYSSRYKSNSAIVIKN